MRVYIAVPFKGEENKKEIEELCLKVRKAGHEDFCFVRDIENYQNFFSAPHKLMQKSKKEIEKSDAFLINYNGPGTGIMIEMGIAYTLNKKVILITKKGTKIRNSIKGVTSKIIEYQKLDDIIAPLSDLV
ncbi:nucleoside 2-deoxyribosyltransferase [Patescibacteria group bacterium]